MVEELVSIIICVYNGEKYIESCLKSVLAQTYPNIEAIVVDDGSTDRTSSIVKNFPGIKYIYQENKGVAEARNTGLKYCNGDYIAWLDADDLYLPEKVEEQVNFLRKYKDIDCVYNDTFLIDVHDNVVKKLKSDYDDLNQNDFLAQLLFRQVIPCMPSTMYRKKCFEGLRIDPCMKYAEDYWMCVQLAQRFKFGYLRKALYKYRRHDSNLTNNKAKQEEMEIKVVKQLGVEKIKRIIEESSYPEHEKLLLLSKIFIKIMEYAEASKTLEKIQFLDPIQCKETLFFKYFYLGNANYLMKEYKKAKYYYQVAIQADPCRAEAYNNLGVTLFNLSGKMEAVRNFNKAIDLRKEYLDPRRNIKSIQTGVDDLKITIRELRDNLMVY
jgi:glycosyltransferase involved in cell wall biosynthesis